jgi:hypothetical protein
MLVDAGCAPALARALAAGAALDPASRPTAATFHQLLRDAGPALAGTTAGTGSNVRRDAEPGTLVVTDPGAYGNVRRDEDADVERACVAESDRDADLDPDGVWHAVIDEEAITLDFGPRPPRPDAPAPASRPRAVLIGSAVAAVVGVLLIAVGGLQLLGAVEGTAAHRDAASDATWPTADTSPGSLPIPRAPDGDRDRTTSRCAEPPSADATGSRAPVTRLEADVDASGCPATIEWRADTAEATVQTTGERHRFQLGVAGDVLLVGDWDGDGRASPALYRPPTGEVFEFDRWASTDRPEPTVTGRLTGVRGGQASVRHVGGHDAVEIEPPHAER